MKSTLRLLAIAFVLAHAWAADWSDAGNLTAGRDYHSATLLPSGKVLIAGGYDEAAGYPTGAELYDPAANTWSAAGSVVPGRSFHTTTLLPNGKVLVTGGYGSGGYMASVQMYDPAANAWSPGANLTVERFSHTATLLASGKVLIAGGAGPIGLTASAQLYDPANGGSSTVGSLGTARYYHSATLLPNGKVLVAGGIGASGELSSAELYDPATNAWTDAGSFTTGRAHHTATLLPNGKVLIAGGIVGSNGYLASAQLYDPAANAWGSTGSLATARTSHAATLLPSGHVLVTGGHNGSILASAELYDPATGVWSPAASLGTARDAHSATLLANGRVLAVAGHGPSFSLVLSAELYAAPQIAVEQPAGANLVDGTASVGFVAASGSSGPALTFILRNSGTVDLAVGTIGKDGTSAAEFSVDTTGMLTTVPPGGSTTFSVTFTPATGGARPAALHIASNSADESPFDIALAGTGLSIGQDTDGDGMNDAAEFRLAALGFDWQVAQPTLVSTYYTNANAAGLYSQAQYNANRTAGQNDVINAPNTYNLYTLTQVQTLNADVPLLTKDQATGQFKLTLGVRKAADLSQPFTPFPLTAPDTTINAQGELEFLFTVPDNAAFFRVQAR